jgi:DNA repair exonuclease SbcCD ATPase subunit
VKIKSVTIKGFRGFNEERTIDFDECLTLIYAPNSYGKTSISEALEWLLYGKTSKVKEAESYSKEEYKGSYRNRHLPESLTPFVKATFVDDGSNEIKFRGELKEDETIQRFINGKEVDNWPLTQDLSKIPKPFILQHALKYLLLVGPSERYRGFTGILGLEKLEEFQQHIINFHKKTKIPDEVEQFRRKISELKNRLKSQPSLHRIEKAFDRGKAGLTGLDEAINSECKSRVPPETEDKNLVQQLLKIREDAVNKIFENRIILESYTESENKDNKYGEDFFLSFKDETFLGDYKEINELAVISNLKEREKFFNLGSKLLDDELKQCPFCGQSIKENLKVHIKEELETIAAEKKRYEILDGKHMIIVNDLDKLKNIVEKYKNRHIKKSEHLLALEPKLEKLRSILLPNHEKNYDEVQNTVSQLTNLKNEIEELHNNVINALEEVQISVNEYKADTKLLDNLGKFLDNYIARIHDYDKIISDKSPVMSIANKSLEQELDKLAKTEDITLLIDLLEKRNDIEKEFEIQMILENLKKLKDTVNQYVTDKVFDAISKELTSDVMEWYGLIKTEGDPDVHFGGFDIARTIKGELKARRVQIKATSYDKELVSAVSSLSESKLNALGLCLNIAVNLKGETPFDFIIIDDPIQSWDADHEIQFIEVIRKLIERGKQIILMSHNKKWIDRVRNQCRTINGCYYEITGYKKNGPYIEEFAWVKWEKRLNDIDAIIKDSTADIDKLRHAEDEFRFIFPEIIAEHYHAQKKTLKKLSALSSEDVRKKLIECGIDEAFADKVTAALKDADEAHHDSENYNPDRERIRIYYDTAWELANKLNDLKKSKLSQ